MNKKWLLGIILGITTILIIIIMLFTLGIKYNKLIISNDKWNEIIKNRSNVSNIKINNIKFNDYSLIIDENNSVIYYSVVNVKNKYNPSIEYKLSSNKLKVVVNKKLSDEVLEDDDTLEIMIYNDKNYRVYTLVVTMYPILNVNYLKDSNNDKKNIELELFDNHVNSTRRLLKSAGKLRVVEENKEYSFSLIRKSLGNNKRDNYVSVFGMNKQNEYLIRVTDSINDRDKYVQFFINNEYKGLYTFAHKEGSVDKFERNRENNR